MIFNVKIAFLTSYVNFSIILRVNFLENQVFLHNPKVSVKSANRKSFRACFDGQNELFSAVQLFILPRSGPYTFFESKMLKIQKRNIIFEKKFKFFLYNIPQSSKYLIEKKFYQKIPIQHFKNRFFRKITRLKKIVKISGFQNFNQIFNKIHMFL